MTSETTILVGGRPLKLMRSGQSPLDSLIAAFPTSSLNAVGYVKLAPGKRCALEADLDSKALVLEYRQPLDSDETRRLEIGFLQAIARFTAVLTAPQGLLLLHGSTVMTDAGAGVLFLDDGKGLGKTSLAVAVAKEGGAIVIDEFSFLDVASDTIRGGAEWPVHVRSDMISALGLCPFSREEIHAVPSVLGLRVVAEVKPTVCVFPRVAPRRPRIIELSRAEAWQRLESNPRNHIEKFFQPRLDRVSFLDVNDPIKVKAASFPTFEVISDFLHELAGRIQIFEVNLGDPSMVLLTARALLAALINLRPGDSTSSLDCGA